MGKNSFVIMAQKYFGGLNNLRELISRELGNTAESDQLTEFARRYIEDGAE